MYQLFKFVYYLYYRKNLIIIIFGAGLLTGVVNDVDEESIFFSFLLKKK
jgi:hypothetical protein